MAITTSLADRFWPKVSKEGHGGCWRWLAATKENGYGVIGRGGQGAGYALAHRVAYELLVGPIPDGLQIDHLCRNRWCVNPVHLEPVTLQENVRRGEGLVGKNIRKTQCPQGHPYAGANLLSRPDGSRACRACNHARYLAKRQCQAL